MRLVYAAADRLKKYSYHSPECSTTEVARDIHRTQPIIHYHFGDKAKLFKHALNWLELHDFKSFEYVQARELSDASSFIHGGEND